MSADLLDARTAADTAAAKAADLRARIDNGDTTVTPDELAAAESAERLADVQLTGAQRRDDERRDREAAAQLERDRAAIQQEWAATGTEPDDLVQLRAAAVDAARAYLEAYTRHQDYLGDLTRRAAAAGFKVTDRSRPSPLPQFGRAVVDASRDVMDRIWTHVNTDVRNHNIWGF